MTRAGRSASHRSKKKRLTLALAPVAALVVAVPLMNSAGAATPNEVSADCAANSDRLESCQFVDVQSRQDSFGPNERVSPVTDNCGSTSQTTKSFAVRASVETVVQTETGAVSSQELGTGALGASIFELGLKYNTQAFDIKRDSNATSFSVTRSDPVLPDHIAFFLWSHARTDVGGFLRATYKEAQDGQKVFFSPSEGGNTVHVFYPHLLKNGSPDGKLWLRNVKCGTPQADGILNSDGSLRAEPGFGEGGENVTDVEIPLSELSGITVE